MMKGVLLPVLLICILVAACGSPTETTTLETGLESPAPPAGNTPIPATSTSIPKATETDLPEMEETEAILTQEDECPGATTNPIGQGIADEYEFSSYAEVMAWFCDGAEFEDILVALQTEELSDTPAEELLVMLAEGLTWEDIWLVTGVIE